MKYFLALPLPPDLANQLISLVPFDPGIEPLEPQDLHITLRFVGDLKPAVFDEMLEALKEIKGPQIPIHLSGCGCFSEGKLPKILWVGVEKNPELIKLQHDISNLLDSFKIPRASHAFFPHLTLARLNNASPELLAQFLARHSKTTWDPYLATYWSLFQSHSTKSGPHYEEKVSYSLGSLMDYLLG